ncbi:hypothetical protein J7L05_10350 [bacterium]|nr:hypothetical protein [bacterium]
MVDLTFKVVAVILFVVGVVFRFFISKDPSEGALLMVTGVFIFLLAHIITELGGIRERLDKKE